MLTICRIQVHHPEKFVPGVKTVEILADNGLTGAGVERRMWVGENPVPIHEIIRTVERTATKGTLDFAMHQHPVIQGSVFNTVEAIGDGSVQCKLTYVMRWRQAADAPPPMGGNYAAGIKGAVLKSKEVMEAIGK